MKFTKKMKKLFIASLVLVIIAVILCVVGALTSKGRENPLFSQSQNDMGQYIFTYEFDTSSVKKISLELSYADVKVYKSSGAAMIEMINYPIDNFSMTVSATTVSIEEKSAIGNFLSFDFDGFRNYFNSLKMAAKRRSVNIYIPDTSALKLFDIDVYSGDVLFEELSVDADYNIELDYGDVRFKNCSSAGELSAKISEGNLIIDASELYSVSAELKKGYEEIKASVVTKIDADIEKGYFKQSEAGKGLASSVVRLKTENGRVRFCGDIYENGSFSQGMEYSGASGVVQTIINVDVSEGNIMITE